MQTSAIEDVVITFKHNRTPVSFIRVASTGSGFGDRVPDMFKHMLKDGYAVEVGVIQPSRFTPKMQPTKIKVWRHYWDMYDETEDLVCNIISVGTNEYGHPVYTFRHPDRLSLHVIEGDSLSVVGVE